MPVFPEVGSDDHGAGLQQSPGLRVLDHGKAHPVLGGAGGIQVFQLGQHLGGEAVPGSIPLQSQQGVCPISSSTLCAIFDIAGASYSVDVTGIIKG